MKKKVKIATIGGGSSYTPELMEGFIKRYDELPIKEIWLVDVEEGKDKQEIVGKMAQRMWDATPYDVKIHTTLDRKLALKDADFVYTDVWYGLYEAEMPKDERMKIFYPTYQVNMDAIKKCNKDVKFLHCLPATRGEEVTDEVMDSKYSIVFDQAENRLTAMRGLLVYFMDKMEETTIKCNKDLGRK